ncbi:MAG: hypothetical protein ABSF63_14705 [Candidatus Bathyarchaeia archaeon]
MNLQVWKTFMRLIAWLCSVFWTSLAVPFAWIQIMAFGLLASAIRSIEGATTGNLKMFQ